MVVYCTFLDDLGYFMRHCSKICRSITSLHFVVDSKKLHHIKPSKSLQPNDLKLIKHDPYLIYYIIKYILDNGRRISSRCWVNNFSKSSLSVVVVFNKMVSNRSVNNSATKRFQNNLSLQIRSLVELPPGVVALLNLEYSPSWSR